MAGQATEQQCHSQRMVVASPYRSSRSDAASTTYGSALCHRARMIGVAPLNAHTRRLSWPPLAEVQTATELNLRINHRARGAGVSLRLPVGLNDLENRCWAEAVCRFTNSRGSAKPLVNLALEGP